MMASRTSRASRSSDSIINPPSSVITGKSSSPKSVPSSVIGEEHPSATSVCNDPTAWLAHFDLTGKQLSDEQKEIVNASTASIDANFPGAMCSEVLLQRVQVKLAEFGFKQENTLFGKSLCPDEICHEEGDLPDLLAKHYSTLGASFSLSGLGGVPFTGRTGFAAFAHHVPKGGNVVVVFAPHVAISPKGEVGRYQRDGQEGLSTACGACIGALKAVEAERGPDDPICCPPCAKPLDESDYQMQTIVHHVRERLDAIGAHPSGKMVGLILEVYELARTRMLAMADLGQLNGGQLALLGGVQINMPRPMEDFFLPLSFELRCEGKPVVDLLPYLLPQVGSLAPRSPAGDGGTWTRPAEASASVDATAWACHLELTGKKPSESERAILESATASVRANFAGAVVSEALVSKMEAALAVFGYTQENTLFGSSLCPDEICHEEGDLPDLLAKRYSAEFSLSGLGGVPFTGRTGFAAFAHHAPKDGHVLVVFAPHVAISPEGEVGRCQRDGQDGLSTACGACIGALKAVEAERAASAKEAEGEEAPAARAPPPIADAADYQMQTIVQHVRERFRAIGAHPSGKMVALVLEVYELARARMLAMADLGQLNGGQLALLGGVQINMPRPMEDFFLPLSFELRCEGKPVVDLLPMLTGDKAPVDYKEVNTDCLGGDLFELLRCFNVKA